MYQGREPQHEGGKGFEVLRRGEFAGLPLEGIPLGYTPRTSQCTRLLEEFDPAKADAFCVIGEEVCEEIATDRAALT